ncbi:peptidoglycan-recognition protein LD isoform X2 [Drosophila subpulchrella]|uniref:peptidoglycan-recognition protein LD isoform X2 n=1 Tax=Drosophila subpulchrella TaxID=1486046 RepID=UPI0018A19B35|nr:peptidoglycan-recognition protein LD isoform X2 [Drosophila subpulchrella]
MDSSHLAVIMARRSPSPAGISRSSYGSVGSTENIRIRVEEDCGVSESTPLLAAAQRSIWSPTSSATSSSSSSPSSGNAILTKDCLNWRSVGFLVMCASALALAVYLLWRQTQMPDFGYRLSLVEHDIWSDADLQGQGTLLDPINVIFTHTESTECLEDCPEVLHKLQMSLLEELPYNFLIAGDCQAFEAHGWQYSSNFSRDMPGNSSLVMAFVGNFSRDAPSICQLKTAQALILESLKRRKLQPEYQLYVVGSNTEALQQELSQWPHYAGHLKTK